MNPYSAFIRIKNELYRRGILRTLSVNVPVISVGNLNTGGSGKTPFIQFLIERISRLHPSKKIVVISKSYKASLTFPEAVDLARNDAVGVYGDEPCFLKATTSADVWSGPVKNQTLRAATSAQSCDLAIIDDGFSHLRIRRKLDIVLFDVSRTKRHYRMLPFGHMREPFSSLTRADVVLLTKMESQPEEKLKYFKNKIRQFNTQMFETQFRMSFGDVIKQKVFLVTGIGSAEPLLEELRKNGKELVAHARYADHFAYPLLEQERIANKLARLGDVSFVTTEKDFIKFTHPELLKRAHVVKLRVNMSEENQKRLDAKISKIF